MYRYEYTLLCTYSGQLDTDGVPYQFIRFGCATLEIISLVRMMPKFWSNGQNSHRRMAATTVERDVDLELRRETPDGKHIYISGLGGKHSSHLSLNSLSLNSHQLSLFASSSRISIIRSDVTRRVKHGLIHLWGDWENRRKRSILRGPISFFHLLPITLHRHQWNHRQLHNRTAALHQRVPVAFDVVSQTRGDVDIRCYFYSGLLGE